MGVMDQINQMAPPPQKMEGNLAGAEIKNKLWVLKTPFEITAPPQRRSKPAQFMKPRDDGSMPPDYQWWVPIRLLAWRPAEQSFGYELQADGEGGQTTVDHVLTFDGGSDWRDGQMNAFGQYVQQHGSAGPLKLTKGQQGKFGAPPWVFDDWTVSDYQGPAYSPPPTSAPASAGVNQPGPSMHSTSVAPASTMAPVPPPMPAATPPPMPPAAPPPMPAADPYTYQTRPEDGKRFRWHPTLAPNWEEVPPEPPQGPPGIIPPPQAPPGQTAQPIPAMQMVQGYNNTEGMPSAQVSMPVADGRQMRQAVYQGDGVVAQPSGLQTQNASGQEPRTRQEAGGMGNAPQGAAQTPAAETPALGVEPAASAPQAAPQPAQQGVQSQLLAAYNAHQPIGIVTACEDCLAKQTSPAWFNPADNRWLQGHQCVKAGKYRTTDVTALVKQTVGVTS